MRIHWSTDNGELTACGYKKLHVRWTMFIPDVRCAMCSVLAKERERVLAKELDKVTEATSKKLEKVKAPA